MKTKPELLCILKKKQTTQWQQSHLDYTENKTHLSFNLPPQVNKSESLQNKTVFQNLITQSLRNSSCTMAKSWVYTFEQTTHSTLSCQLFLNPEAYLIKKKGGGNDHLPFVAFVRLRVSLKLHRKYLTIHLISLKLMRFISNRYVFLYYFKLCPQSVLYPVYFIHSESLLAYLKPTNIYIWYKFYTYKQMEQGNRQIIWVKLSKPIDIYFYIQCTKY